MITPDDADGALPRHPRVDPRIPRVRRVTGLQVGVDAGHGVVLSGDATGLRALLDLCDGTRSIGEIADAVGVPEPEVLAVIRALDAHDLLVPARPPRLRVRLIGSGALARDLAYAILDSGMGLVVVDPEPPTARLYPGRAGTGGEALHAHLTAQGRAVGLAAHWLDGTRCGVTVVADDHLEPDRFLVDTLMRDGRPHLFVRPLPRGAVVGPLVIPGATSCLRCHDLVRSADPEWPAVLAQLCGTRLATPATVRRWATGQVLVALRALAAGRHATLRATTVELDRHWQVSAREWPSHPRCGCGVTPLAA